MEPQKEVRETPEWEGRRFVPFERTPLDSPYDYVNNPFKNFIRFKMSSYCRNTFEFLFLVNQSRFPESCTFEYFNGATERSERNT